MLEEEKWNMAISRPLHILEAPQAKEGKHPAEELVD